MSSMTRKKIKNYLDSKPDGCTTAEVADALGITHVTVRRTLRDLYKQGVVLKSAACPVVRWSSSLTRGSGMSDRGRNGKGAPVYTEHMNVKLTVEQAAAIRASGDPDSTWIREAVQERLSRALDAKLSPGDEARLQDYKDVRKLHEPGE